MDKHTANERRKLINTVNELLRQRAGKVSEYETGGIILRFYDTTVEDNKERVMELFEQTWGVSPKKLPDTRVPENGKYVQFWLPAKLSDFHKEHHAKTRFVVDTRDWHPYPSLDEFYRA